MKGGRGAPQLLLSTWDMRQQIRDAMALSLLKEHLWVGAPQVVIRFVCALCCRCLRAHHRCSRCLLSLVMNWCKRYGWLRRPTHSEWHAAGWRGLGGASTNSTPPSTRTRAQTPRVPARFRSCERSSQRNRFPPAPSTCAHRHLKSGKMRRTDGELADVLPWLAEQAQDWEAAAAAGAPAQPPLLPDTRCAG